DPIKFSIGSDGIRWDPVGFEYHEAVKKFAICWYVLGGKQCYEFVRSNLSDCILALTTLDDLINKLNMTLNEAQFRYHWSYPEGSQSLMVFRKWNIIKLASSFDDFKAIYNSSEIAPLLNVHTFQSISTEDDPSNFPKPLLLSAYGVNNKFKTMDVYIQSLLGLRCSYYWFFDRKYLSAMRLASRFFASLPDFKVDSHQHAFGVDIPNDWT
ncbi:unnamed protein product, partial [Adineta ricciae]